MATNLTPIHALPWPDGTERVMDGDNAIGALAVAVDRELEELAKPPGVIVNNAGVQTGLGSASAILLALDTVLLGNPAWFDNANDRVTVPSVAALDGMYSIELFATFNNLLAASTGLSIQIHTGVPGSTAILAGNSIVGQGAVLGYAAVSAIARLQPGWCVEARCGNPVADVGDWRVVRLSVTRMGDILPSS